MALDALDLLEMSDALDKARADAVRARELVPGLISRGWSHLIGADTVDPEANAIATENLVRELEARFSRLSSDPSAGPAEKRDFIAACGVTNNAAAEERANLLSPATAVEQVAAGTAADLGHAAKWTAIIGTPVLVLALLAFLLWKFDPRR